MARGLGFRVYGGSGFRGFKGVRGFRGLWVWGLGFRGLRFRDQGL